MKKPHKKERKWDERDGWLWDDEIYDISFLLSSFIYSWEEMVEMKWEIRMTLERIKRRGFDKKKK